MKRMKITASLLLCLTLMLCLPLGIFAADEQVPEWHLSQDEQTLIYDVAYTRYEMDMHYVWLRPHGLYRYEQTVDMRDQKYLTVAQAILQKDEENLVLCQDTVWLYGAMPTPVAVYVNDQGAERLDDFVAGNYAQYVLATGSWSGSSEAYPDYDMIESWTDSKPDVEVDVTALDGLDSYELLGYDATMTVARRLGRVFDLGNAYIYVQYDNLQNNHFDAEGELSFRQGTVPAYEISDADAIDLNRALANSIPYDNGFETQEIPLTATDGMVGSILMLLMLSPFTLLVPLAVLILSIIMLCVRRERNKKRWIITLALSLFSLLLGAIFSLWMVVPFIFMM